MKCILIFVLVVAVLVMVIGLANLNERADVGYLFGTWDDASLVAVSGVVAGVVLLVGIVAVLLAALHARSDRHKLEVELQQIYVRLRAAEGAQSASAPAVASTPPAIVFTETAESAPRPAGEHVAETPVTPGEVETADEEPAAAASGGESGDEPAG